jgi:magnesium-transporting ATPase (P-type)
VLITGDHPATARAIAAGLGIIGAGEPVIDCRLTQDAEADATATVFARATRSRRSPSSRAARPPGTWSP